MIRKQAFMRKALKGLSFGADKRSLLFAVISAIKLNFGTLILSFSEFNVMTMLILKGDLNEEEIPCLLGKIWPFCKTSI